MNTQDKGTATIKIIIEHISREEYRKLDRNVKIAVQETINEARKSFDGMASSTFDPDPTREPERIPVEDVLPTPLVELQQDMDLYIRSVVREELNGR